MTLFRWDVINHLLDASKHRRFLEIGIQRGVCGAKVKARVKVGVDPQPFDAANRHYAAVYRQTSDNFFAGLPGDERFDVVLVDGLHHADQVLRDVENALQFLEVGGAVVMHDCNPQSELAQRVPREVRVWNGDCWQAMVWLRQRPGLDAFTIDADHGIGVVRKNNLPALLDSAVPPLNYVALEADRVGLLGLVPVDQWRERLAA